MPEKTKLMKEFEQETGKHAIWRGKQTKGYKNWRENKLKEKREKKLIICPWCGKKIKNYITHTCSKKEHF